MFKKAFGIFGICSLFSTFAYGNSENIQVQKKIISVHLNANSKMAQKELALLKNMDVLGVNLKKHEAEVLVTEDELTELKNAHLSIFTKQNRMEALNSAALDDYLNPTKVRGALTALNQKYPQITNVFEFGRTHRDLPMMAVEISSQPGDPKRPVVLFNGMHHAREVMSTEVVMHIANVLTEQYGKDSEVTDWVNNYRIIVIPQVNPDGNTLVHAGQNMWRKNAYTLNGVVRGVDLNRNYPTYWNYCAGSSGTPSSETYRGPSPGSEPETQALMNLVSDTKPVADISYHSYSELIIYPFGCSNVTNPSKALFQKIGQNMKVALRDDRNQLNTYELGTAPELLYNADGSDLDWQWKEKGVIAYTIEVNASDFQPNYKQWRDVTVVRQEGGWKTLLRQMKGSGFHAFVQTSDANAITYSIQQSVSGMLLAFDADNTQKRFSLKSQEGLLYQLTSPGEFQVNFYHNDNLVKTLNVSVGNENADLGTIVLE